MVIPVLNMALQVRHCSFENMFVKFVEHYFYILLVRNKIYNAPSNGSTYGAAAEANE